MKKKRWTLKLTLALLAGAVVTWAVAWGCALWGPSPPGFGENRVDVRWPTGVPLYWPRPDIEHPGRNAVRSRSLIVGDGFDKESGDLYFHEARLSRCGWPFRSMASSEVFDQSLTIYSDGIKAPAWLRPRSDADLLPIRIVPLGFTLNTLLAAAVILTITEGAGARRREGRCPWYGYDRVGVAGDAKCPECGGLA